MVIPGVPFNHDFGFRSVQCHGYGWGVVGKPFPDKIDDAQEAVEYPLDVKIPVLKMIGQTHWFLDELHHVVLADIGSSFGTVSICSGVDSFFFPDECQPTVRLSGVEAVPFILEEHAFRLSPPAQALQCLHMVDEKRGRGSLSCQGVLFRSHTLFPPSFGTSCYQGAPPIHRPR